MLHQKKSETSIPENQVLNDHDGKYLAIFHCRWFILLFSFGLTHRPVHTDTLIPDTSDNSPEYFRTVFQKLSVKGGLQ